jgi:hypothetical protein
MNEDLKMILAAGVILLTSVALVVFMDFALGQIMR